MKTSRIILICILLVIILASSAAGLLLLQNSKDSRATQTKQLSTRARDSGSSQPQAISLDELAKHTGKNGESCWVAVDGIVYEISGFILWAEGEHRPSGGRAKCGKDLSEVIKQSPHGKSVLKLLKEIGRLQQ